ncbi:MAG: mechanosensitive ion channel family protein [Deltaproteobacteria bacterium]|nr:mechanosensitive ion channel family protein [Deltaproteobacteria bacterium]
MDNEMAYVATIKEWFAINGGDFLVDVIVVLIILIVGKFVIKGVRKSLSMSLKKSGRVSEILESFILNVTSKVLWIIVFMLVIQKLGVEIGPLVAGLGVTGFIVGFACQESLANLAAGVMIALNQPFEVGHYVELSGATGAVFEMNMMATTLHTPDNKKVVVPNSSVWGSTITNYTALDTRRVDLVIGISYSSDIGNAKDVLHSVLKENKMILDEPGSTVEVVEMADSSVNFVVRPWCKTADYWDVFFSVNRGAKEALDQAGIEIPFPQMDIHHHGIEGFRS